MVRIIHDSYNDCYRAYLDAKEVAVFCTLEAALRAYPRAQLSLA